MKGKNSICNARLKSGSEKKRKILKEDKEALVKEAGKNLLKQSNI